MEKREYMVRMMHSHLDGYVYSLCVLKWYLG
jgi:hypothetical protein